MKLLAGGCSLIPSGSEYRAEGVRRFRVAISKDMGSRDIIQTISLYDSGRAPSRRNPFAEEVLYVVGGFGACRIDEFAYPLRPGTALERNLWKRIDDRKTCHEFSRITRIFFR